ETATRVRSAGRSVGTKPASARQCACNETRARLSLSPDRIVGGMTAGTRHGSRGSTSRRATPCDPFRIPRMTTLDLATDDPLSTTRAVRKRLDLERPVEREILEECLELAQQAPTAGYSQNWHFVVVTDPAKRAALGELWRSVAYPYLERAGRGGGSGTGEGQ